MTPEELNDLEHKSRYNGLSMDLCSKLFSEIRSLQAQIIENLTKIISLNAQNQAKNDLISKVEAECLNLKNELCKAQEAEAELHSLAVELRLKAADLNDELLLTKRQCEAIKYIAQRIKND